MGWVDGYSQNFCCFATSTLERSQFDYTFSSTEIAKAIQTFNLSTVAPHFVRIQRDILAMASLETRGTAEFSSHHWKFLKKYGIIGCCGLTAHGFSGAPAMPFYMFLSEFNLMNGVTHLHTRTRPKTTKHIHL